MATENHDHPSPPSVEEAIKATTNWRDYLESSNGAFDLKSFWISIDHIQKLLEHNPDADGIRTYLGFKDASDPTSFQFVTLSTKKGVDVIERPDGKSDVILKHLYCPPICPTGGVLNG